MSRAPSGGLALCSLLLAAAPSSAAERALIGCFESPSTRVQCNGIERAPACNYTANGSPGVMTCNRKGSSDYECAWVRGDQGGTALFKPTRSGFSGTRSDGVRWVLAPCAGARSPAPLALTRTTPAAGTFYQSGKLTDLDAIARAACIERRWIEADAWNRERYGSALQRTPLEPKYGVQGTGGSGKAHPVLWLPCSQGQKAGISCSLPEPCKPQPGPTLRPSPAKPLPAPPTRAATPKEIKDFLQFLTGKSHSVTPLWERAHAVATEVMALQHEADAFEHDWDAPLGNDLCAAGGPFAPACAFATGYAQLIAGEFAGEGDCALGFTRGSAHAFADWMTSTPTRLVRRRPKEECFLKGYRLMIERLDHARDGYLQQGESFQDVPALEKAIEHYLWPLFRSTAGDRLLTTAYQVLLVDFGKTASREAAVKVGLGYYNCMPYGDTQAFPDGKIPPAQCCVGTTTPVCSGNKAATPTRLPY